MPRPPQAPDSKNTHGAEAEAAKAARKRELLNASNVRKKLEEIRRPLGITPVAIRYASRSDEPIGIPGTASPRIPAGRSANKRVTATAGT